MGAVSAITVSKIISPSLSPQASKGRGEREGLRGRWEGRGKEKGICCREDLVGGGKVVLEVSRMRF